MDRLTNDMKLLTLEEIAEILHVSKRTLHRLIKKKKLPAFKLGGQWRISEATLRQWLKDYEQRNGSV